MVILEITLIFLLSLLFSILTVFSKTKIVWSLLAMICWFILSLTYMLSSPLVAGLSFLWFGIGLIFLITFIANLFEILKMRKEEW